MTRILSLVSAIAVSYGFATISVNAHSADATCIAMIKQTLPRPDLPYRVEQDMLIDGKVVKNQAVYIEGYMHVKPENGKWIRTQKPVDPKAVEALALETTRDCKLTGSEIVGGMKMNVWTVKSTTPFDKSITTSRTWIGAADGRVYRLSSQGLEQRIYYDNVIKPEVAEGRRRNPAKNG
jgi:hypothetical protein